MPAFHHKETKKVFIISGPISYINSSILVETKDDIPDYEWNQVSLADLPIEVAFKGGADHQANVIDKVTLFSYLKSINQGPDLWITRFSDGAPQKETT